VDGAIEDLSRSLKAEGLFLPPRGTIAAEVLDFFKKGAVATEKVNSDNDVQKLLDDNAELKLRTPCNVFIGGQILDRGITVPNLIGFYYGRSPKRMQQDTVLQHARMYGDRARPDLAVTRFYATAHNYLALRSIHEFDTALRHAFEKGAHDRGVAFVLKDQTNRVIPCAPNKILVSDIVALRPGSAYLPVGFRTKSRTTMVPIMQKLDRLIPVGKLEAGTISEITSDNAIEIIDLIESCFVFEPGYGFDWEACRAAIEYWAQSAMPLTPQLIDAAVERYWREVDRYDKLSKLVGESCRSLIEENGIRGSVQWRAKHPDRLKAKLQKYLSSGEHAAEVVDLDGVFRVLKDLAGARITTYVETDRVRVIALVQKRFSGFGTGSTITADVKDQPAEFYRATHCMVRLKGEDTVGQYQNLKGLGCEIQVQPTRACL
jgi:ppGpp synthetase/RelA/SpoT-type nucleotidyltranferase